MRGNVVIYPFPHTDLSEAKNRPALVIKKLSGVDAISCLITTKSTSSYAIKITQKDVKSGHLKHDCFARPDRLFTADTRTFLRTVCTLKDDKVEEVMQQAKKFFS